MGAAGSILLERGAEGLVRQAAIPATAVVDTTGAGDSFTAGYAVGILEGMPPGDAMRLGAAVASIVVGRIGAMSSLPSRKEVDALLRA